MGKKRNKFIVALALLVGGAVWLGWAGTEESKAYYKTCDEFLKLDATGQARRTRLMGNVADGSIRRDGGKLSFSLTLNDATIPVVYLGRDPVPDTFKDGVSALVEGRMGGEGRFEARTIQAKCASKYEADPSKAYTKPPPSAPPAGI